MSDRRIARSVRGASARASSVPIGSRAITIISGAVLVLLFARDLHTAAFRDQIDFEVYRAGGRALLTGHDLYALRVPPVGLPFTYPPASAELFASLAAAPVRAGQVVWTALSFIGLCVFVRLTLRRYATGLAATSVAVLLAVLVLVVRSDPVRVNFDLGQVNVLIALLIVADLGDVWPQLPRGVMIGLAAALKLTPLFLIVYFVVVRRYRAASVATATFVAVTLGAWAVAPRASGEYWLRGYFADARRTGGIAYISNQSINGVLLRITGGSNHAHALWMLLAITSAAAVLWQLRRVHEGRPWLAEAIALAMMLLVSPVSWLHHWILVLPLLVAGFRLSAERLRGRRLALLLTAGLCATLWFGVAWKVPNTHLREEHLGVIQTIVGNSDALLLVALVGVALAVSRDDDAERPRGRRAWPQPRHSANQGVPASGSSPARRTDRG